MSSQVTSTFMTVKTVPLHAKHTILDPGAGTGRTVSASPQPLYPQEGEVVPTVQRQGRASESFWMCPENFSPAAFPTPDRPARSDSLVS